MTHPAPTDALPELLPCPFCGHDTPEFERRGTRRHSCIVVCGNCGCRHESSDEDGRSGSSWNDRAPSAELAALRERVEAAEAWHAQFNLLALELKCLPSRFIDANDHVFRAAKAGVVARAAQEGKT